MYEQLHRSFRPVLWAGSIVPETSRMEISKTNAEDAKDAEDTEESNHFS
jgi:hypothetical protein